ncbi:hypothetical protein K402DRAFT_420855 [Aulographum hederae CBS 113979]|uniref:Uncharacterized protein n=1 Tax=Aulographum hederae CBS 113979 TaxID=1176131 RepID=A0A6G1H1A8_9PEZI|nr:hypothetical protein K402DRAFT_420855 [Aulographum hederae CBS 113979]
MAAPQSSEPKANDLDSSLEHPSTSDEQAHKTPAPQPSTIHPPPDILHSALTRPTTNGAPFNGKLSSSNSPANTSKQPPKSFLSIASTSQPLPPPASTNGPPPPASATGAPPPPPASTSPSITNGPPKSGSDDTQHSRRPGIKRGETDNWNDIPSDFLAPPSRGDSPASATGGSRASSKNRKAGRRFVETPAVGGVGGAVNGNGNGAGEAGRVASKETTNMLPS